MSLLGASGCGKTTTLRLIAGFLPPTTGRIRLGNTDLARLPAHKRDIGPVFQNYALFPHLTVRENVAFGLKQRGVGAEARRKQAEAMLDRVGLTALADRLPGALSGGQRRRVALARALVIEPLLLMFDQPLSNLDAKLRVEMRQLQRANGTTSFFVTHDQEEAIAISDRVAIKHQGRIIQFDTPEVLYQRPANAFLAAFVGFENMTPMTVVARHGVQVEVEVAGHRLTLRQEDFGEIPDRFTLVARADGLSVTQGAAELPVTLGLRTYLGRACEYLCDTPAGSLTATGPLARPFDPGTAARPIPNGDQCCILRG